MGPASSIDPPSPLLIHMPLIELQYKYLQLKHQDFKVLAYI
jgi:hypothetical protein